MSARKIYFTAIPQSRIQLPKTVQNKPSVFIFCVHFQLVSLRGGLGKILWQIQYRSTSAGRKVTCPRRLSCFEQRAVRHRTWTPPQSCDPPLGPTKGFWSFMIDVFGCCFQRSAGGEGRKRECLACLVTKNRKKKKRIDINVTVGGRRAEMRGSKVTFMVRM